MTKRERAIKNYGFTMSQAKSIVFERFGNVPLCVYLDAYHAKKYDKISVNIDGITHTYKNAGSLFEPNFKWFLITA